MSSTVSGVPSSFVGPAFVNFPVPPPPPATILPFTHFWINQGTFHIVGTIEFDYSNSTSFGIGSPAYIDNILIAVAYDNIFTLRGDFDAAVLTANVTIAGGTSGHMTLAFDLLVTGGSHPFGQVPTFDLRCGPAAFWIKYGGMSNNTNLRRLPTVPSNSVKLTVSNIEFVYDVVDGLTPICGAPCNCNGDCPPCSGSNAVGSGQCLTMCASSGTTPALVQGWVISDKNGGVVANSGTASNGWGVTRPSKCQLTVCAPCLTQDQVKAGNYQGPYTVTWGTNETCDCNGTAVYKTLVAGFTEFVKVVCPSTIPPDAGSSPSYDVDFSGRHARGFVAIPAGSVGGELKVGTASNVFPLVWNDVKTGIPASAVSLRWHRQQGQARLYALVQQGLGMKLFISHDDGQTFDAGRIIATNGGGIPCLVICRDGRIICFAGAGQNNTVFDSVLNPIGHVDVGPATPYHVDEYVGAGTNWRFTTFSLSSDGVVQVGQSADGSAWTYKDAGKGLHPTGIVCADGRRIAYYVRDDGGSDGINIWGRFFDATGIPSGDEFKAVRGVDKDSIAADEAVAGDVWHATLLFVVQGKLTCKTSTDGVVFTD